MLQNSSHSFMYAMRGKTLKIASIKHRHLKGKSVHCYQQTFTTPWTNKNPLNWSPGSYYSILLSCLSMLLTTGLYSVTHFRDIQGHKAT